MSLAAGAAGATTHQPLTLVVAVADQLQHLMPTQTGSWVVPHIPTQVAVVLASEDREEAATTQAVAVEAPQALGIVQTQPVTTAALQAVLESMVRQGRLDLRTSHMRVTEEQRADQGSPPEVMQ